VRVTLQVQSVLLPGLVIGSRLEALSQLEYLAIGFAGAPVLALGKFGLVSFVAGFVSGLRMPFPSTVVP